MENLDVKKIGEVTVVKMPKSVDSTTAGEVESQLLGIIKSGVHKLVCDFTGNNYVSSAGLRVFMEASNELEERNGKMAVFGLNEVVYEVFDITGFADVFPITDNEKEAIDSL
ncbi:MAG TPA: STAS domain-containing protein [Patescibacteria group bacterium]|nr:STAS domain-containing protein [Patescibacteria group bacterium]